MEDQLLNLVVVFEARRIKGVTVEAEVHSSSVSVVYVVLLCIAFSKAVLQKRGSMEPMEARPSGSATDACLQIYTFLSILLSYKFCVHYVPPVKTSQNETHKTPHSIMIDRIQMLSTNSY